MGLAMGPTVIGAVKAFNCQLVTPPEVIAVAGTNEMLHNCPG